VPRTSSRCHPSTGQRLCFRAGFALSGLGSPIPVSARLRRNLRTFPTVLLSSLVACVSAATPAPSRYLVVVDKDAYSDPVLRGSWTTTSRTSISCSPNSRRWPWSIPSIPRNPGEDCGGARADQTAPRNPGVTGAILLGRIPYMTWRQPRAATGSTTGPRISTTRTLTPNSSIWKPPRQRQQRHPGPEQDERTRQHACRRPRARARRPV